MLLLRCQLEIFFVDDVVALEDAAGLVARNRHGDSLRHAGAYHVATLQLISPPHGSLAGWHRHLTEAGCRAVVGPIPSRLSP